MPEITGNTTEDKVPYEGMITYDVRFYVWTPDRSAKLKLLVDVEAQKDFYPGYDIVTRGIFYSARMISAQKGTEFTGTNYDKIKKIYSIWICMNSPRYAENTVTAFHMVQDNKVGTMPSGKFRYDIPNIILVCLSKELAEEKDELKLHRLLGILFSDTMLVEEKKQRLEEEYHIAMSKEMERRSSAMCNLSEAILERGISQGKEEGREEGREEGLKALVSTLKRFQLSKEEICIKIRENETYQDLKDEEILKFY